MLQIRTMSKEIRIIATDGDSQKEMAVINHRGHEIAVGWVPEGPEIGHFTYHTDGYAHFKNKIGDNITRESKIQGPPLDDFIGFCSVFQGGIFDDLSVHADNSPYDTEDHYDSIIYIDNRESEDFVNEHRTSESSHVESVQYRVFIVEQGFDISTIINNCKKDDPDIHVHLYTHTDPWIMVAYWPAPSRGARFLPQFSTNFEYISEPNE